MAKNFDKYLNNINEEEISPVEAALEASGNYAPKTKRLKINPSELSENSKLNSIFEIKDDVLQKITESMKKNGFNEEEPITLWVNPENGKMEILDGHTRKIAAENAGLKIVSCVVKNDIKTIEQAVEYAKNRQRNRRNLTPEELLYFATEERDFEYGEGRDSEIKAKELGVSTRQIDNLKFIKNNATPEQLEAFKKSEASANALVEEIKNKKYIEDNADDEEKDLIRAGLIDEKEFVKNKKKEQKKQKEQDEDDKKHDSLSEGNAGQPAGLGTFNHSDGHERPEVSVAAGAVNNESDRLIAERRASYQEGFNEGQKKCGAGAEKLFYYAVALQLQGLTPEQIAESVSDFSPSVISNFTLTEEQLTLLEEKLGVTF